MTKQGKSNLLSMLLLPAAAVLAAFISKLNGVWDAYGATYIAILVINGIVAVFGGFFSWLFLRRSIGDTARWIAILPMLLPAVSGSVWYLFRAVVPAEIAAGYEYLGVPQYLILGVFATMFVVLLGRVTRLLPRVT